ncbi:class I SAM-dependent methyltransferase [Gimesia algae]|uniref:Trans-aconitate 2-methyltransferase n=1 Tax=Gimesia algae TaxID=2527971 RepID=A0A517VLE1_9PLAN|nr:methyltransferase domain-containing protein [Gimesia algae]QDT93832.1 Trans-aconitate 2-methyltransferase [Gimesia algae]
MTTDTAFTFGWETTAHFECRLQEMINQGSLTLMLSIGYRTGLFEVLGTLDAASCEEIAERAGLKPQYVKDWLEVMTTGGILEHDSLFQTYRLPAEQAALLLQRGRTHSYATSVQWVSLSGKLEDEIVTCFREGGPLPSDLFTQLQSQLAEDNSVSIMNGLFQHVLPLVPSLIMQLCEGRDVLDLGCGCGNTLIELARMFPASRFSGYDSSSTLIEKARRTAEEEQIENVTFIQRELSEIHAIDAFDLVTAFDVLQDQAQPFRILDQVLTALRPEGLFLMQDLARSRSREINLQNPLSTLMFSLSCLRSMVNAEQDQTADGSRWCQEIALQTLQEAGFTSIDVHTLPHDLVNDYYVARKPPRPVA